MAKVAVTYTTKLIQIIDWPDRELSELSYNNLICNLDSLDSISTGDYEIEKVELNGKDYTF